MSFNVASFIANELSVTEQRVIAAVNLLDEGSSVPFIARYRKELTGSLDDTQLRMIEERLSYLRELDARKVTIIKSIEDQGKMTSALKASIAETVNKAELEDLYLPYKPKRRTKAEKAREAGLQALADKIMATPSLDPYTVCDDFINEEKEIKTAEDVLAGTRDIIMEELSENAAVNSYCRDYVWQHAVLTCEVVKTKEEDAAKFKDYFAYSEKIKTIPSHRALAVFRGRTQGFLRVKLALEDQNSEHCKAHLASTFNLNDASKWLTQAMDWTWKIKLFTKLEIESLLRLKEHSEAAAIDVFAENLSNLLMASPSGAKVTMGLDPGYRTGVKAVVVDKTGKLLVHSTIFPHAPQKKWDASVAKLAQLCSAHDVELISIGNGTASRETNALVAELLKKPEHSTRQKIVISEAGASVYSASALAAEEFPDLDVTYRGAVSIARRLQDPLAELVKIDPKSIGVGQYQHDVNQIYLAKKLDKVVEDCVNSVGVDVNMASAALLARIAGLNSTLAQNIVKYRDGNGAFKNRKELLKVERMGAKTFEQAAGFLRISDGENALDASSVHPEAYQLAEQMLNSLGIAANDSIGNAQEIEKINPAQYISDQFGLPTITDILNELKKPGRDPRGQFKMAALKEGVEKLSDLSPDMILEGTVTNVTEFGAFVDIGVHQDGLVHKSELGAGYVQDPAKVIKVGDIVKVRVLEVDVNRKRISLSKRLEKAKGVAGPGRSKKQDKVSGHAGHKKKAQSKRVAEPKMQSALAQALGQALVTKT